MREKEENMTKAEVSKQSSKDQPKVSLQIEYGPTTTIQRQAWRRLWIKLLADAKEKEKDSNS
jgi:hypothetical protein